ncbi:hypothetical protein C8R46DRAFT_1349176 [Mycena filopes]|nr:hypothetical protein C8R46DRAFT_1349176 [Mycena filopes]
MRGNCTAGEFTNALFHEQPPFLATSKSRIGEVFALLSPIRCPSTRIPASMSSPGFNAVSTIGALQIGVFFAVCLFGAVTVQVALYHTRFPSDPYVIKALVMLVWCLDFGHTFAICHGIYIITVVQYGHPELLEFVPNSLNAAILFSGLIGPLQQTWFAYRLYKFSQSRYLPIFCVLLSTSRAGGGLALGAIALTRMPVLLFVEKMNRLVNRLMQLSIETGLITSLGATSLLVCFITMPDNFYWIAISFVLSKLFSNSLMFSLNTRKPELHISPDPRRRESLLSMHSADPLTTEVRSSVQLGRNSSSH